MIEPKIEEVKRKLSGLCSKGMRDCNYDCENCEEFNQICQLFEPKPDKSRLLTGEEVAHEMPAGELKLDQKFAFAEVVAKAQDAKTASIKNVEMADLKETIRYLGKALEVTTEVLQKESGCLKPGVSHLKAM